tara:strand:- start:26 stop:253 length:228 start_codon:yes stop_codon:yes gene_type:complete
LEKLILKMKKSALKLIIILIGIILIYLAKTNFSEYNLEKSISACIVAQKRTSESFDLEKSKKHCEERVRKQKEAY